MGSVAQQPAALASPDRDHLSYSLYLTHCIANDVVRVLRLPVAAHWMLPTGGALVGSYLYYRLFEAPMRDWLGE